MLDGRKRVPVFPVSELQIRYHSVSFNHFYIQSFDQKPHRRVKSYNYSSQNHENKLNNSSKRRSWTYTTLANQLLNTFSRGRSYRIRDFKPRLRDLNCLMNLTILLQPSRNLLEVPLIAIRYRLGVDTIGMNMFEREILAWIKCWALATSGGEVMRGRCE